MTFNLIVGVSQDRTVNINASNITEFKVKTDIDYIDVTDGVSQGEVQIDKYFFIMTLVNASALDAEYQVPWYGTYNRLIDTYDLRDDKLTDFQDYLVWDYDPDTGEHTLYEIDDDGDYVVLVDHSTTYADIYNAFIAEGKTQYRSASLMKTYKDVAYATLDAKATINTINAFAKVYEKTMQNLFSTHEGSFVDDKETYTLPIE